jgi:ketosteroid isomerase-like protein
MKRGAAMAGDAPENRSPEMNDDAGTTFTTEAQMPARVLHAMLDALEALEPERAADCFAADGVLDLPYAPDGFPGYHAGRAAIAEFLLRFPHYYRRIRYLDRRITPLADGSGAVGEYRGEWETVKGRPYNNTYIALVRVRDGKISHFREFFHPLVWLESLGRAPTPRPTSVGEQG